MPVTFTYYLTRISALLVLQLKKQVTFVFAQVLYCSILNKPVYENDTNPPLNYPHPHPLYCPNGSHKHGAVAYHTGVWQRDTGALRHDVIDDVTDKRRRLGVSCFKLSIVCQSTRQHVLNGPHNVNTPAACLSLCQCVNNVSSSDVSASIRHIVLRLRGSFSSTSTGGTL